MGIKSGGLIFTALFICINSGINTANAGLMLMFPASSKGGGQVMGFPDVCKTPAPPGSPVPIAYPNVISRSQSKLPAGKKQTKKGNTIIIKKVSYKTAAGNEASGYKVGVLSRSGRPVRLRKSTLFQLRDGSYCAVCVRNGRITRVLKMHAVAKPRIVRKKRAVGTRRLPVRRTPVRR